MVDRYTLNDAHEPVPEPDLLTWALWMDQADRRVARTKLESGFEVSTVFLGLDHNFFGEGPPILFETMIFRPAADGNWKNDEWTDLCHRYATWAEAETGHMEIVEQLGVRLKGRVK
jgi:hypothetical protein